MFKRLPTALALASAVFAGPALAATATATFQVSITVENDCRIAVNDLNFGLVNDLAPAINGATTGTVTCTGRAPVSISFDPGTGGASSFATRQMQLGTSSDTIDYNLYRDATRTEILGDGTSGTVTIDFTSTGGTDGFDVFGQTVPGQNPKPTGTYTSFITATVEF